MIIYSWYPYFPGGRKMCLMGDIKARVYYSSWDNLQVSICTIRILVYYLYESLDCHYEKSLVFEKNTNFSVLKISRFQSYKIQRFWKVWNFTVSKLFEQFKIVAFCDFDIFVRFEVHHQNSLLFICSVNSRNYMR